MRFSQHFVSFSHGSLDTWQWVARACRSRHSLEPMLQGCCLPQEGAPGATLNHGSSYRSYAVTYFPLTLESYHVLHCHGPRPIPTILTSFFIPSLYPEVEPRDLRLPSCWDVAAAAHEESHASALPRTGSQHLSTGFHTPLPASQVCITCFYTDSF